jgi:hypothetical protein
MYALQDQTLKERGIPATCEASCLPFPHRVTDPRCYQHEDYKVSVALSEKSGTSVDEPDW